MNKCRQMYEYRIIVSILHEGQIDKSTQDVYICQKSHTVYAYSNQH